MTERDSKLDRKVKVIDKPVDIAPQKVPTQKAPLDLRLRPLGPNMAKQNPMAMKFGDSGQRSEVHYKSNAALRNKQQEAIRVYVSEREVDLYRKTRAGTVTEKEQAKAINVLRRMKNNMIATMPEWLGDTQPFRHGRLTQECFAACQQEFNRLKVIEDHQVSDNPAEEPVKLVVSDDFVPAGPVTGLVQEQPHDPDTLKLEDLTPVEQPLASGPLSEQSVLETGLQQPELPVFVPGPGGVDVDIVFDTKEDSGKLDAAELETEENSDVHPVRPDEVSPPESGNRTI